MAKHAKRERRPKQAVVADSPDQTSATTSPIRLTFTVQLASVCALAFFLRLLHVMQTFEVPTIVRLLGDAQGYFLWGSKIAAGDWYGTETFYQAPLYPYFLAVLIKVFGPSITIIRIVQSILGVAGVALIGLAGRKMFTARLGIITATMLAVYPPAIYYDGIVQKAALASFLLCAFLAACVYVQHQQRPWLALLAGVALGLLVITRENALLWVPILPGWIVLGLADLAIKRRFVLAGCAVTGLAVILLPVAARNASLGGEWSPTTFQAGPNFYIGNNLGANGIYRPLVPGHETPMYERADAQRLAEQAEQRELSAREVSRFWMQRALGEISESPIRWIQLMIAKSFMVVNRYEVPDVESLYVFREYSAPLSIGRLWQFGLLCPLGCWGLFVTRRDWRSLWLYYVLLATMVAAIILFFILGRYRHPLAILLMPFAAVGVYDLWQRIRSRDFRSIAVATAAMVTLGVLCNVRVHEEKTLNASCYMNLGVSAGQAGDLRSSIQGLQKAIYEFPAMAEAHFNLGRAFSISGQPMKAVQSYRVAIQIEPGLAGANYFLAESLEKTGDPAAAIQHYQ